MSEDAYQLVPGPWQDILRRDFLSSTCDPLVLPITVRKPGSEEVETIEFNVVGVNRDPDVVDGRVLHTIFLTKTDDRTEADIDDCDIERGTGTFDYRESAADDGDQGDDDD